MKVEADTRFIKSCKNGSLIPKLAKVKLAIKSSKWKLHLRIAWIIMERKIQIKHRIKKKLKKDIASIIIQLKSPLGLFSYSALIYEIYYIIKGRYKATKSRHEKRFQKCWSAQKSKTKFQNYVYWKAWYTTFHCII